jgi:hypothetical protein
MSVWMHGCMDAWMDACMDGCTFHGSHGGNEGFDDELEMVAVLVAAVLAATGSLVASHPAGHGDGQLLDVYLVPHSHCDAGYDRSAPPTHTYTHTPCRHAAALTSLRAACRWLLTADTYFSYDWPPVPPEHVVRHG